MIEFEHIENDAAFEQAVLIKIAKIKQKRLKEASLTEEDLEQQLRMVQLERTQKQKELDDHLKQHTINLMIQEYNNLIESLNQELSVLEANGFCEHTNHSLEELEIAHNEIKESLEDSVRLKLTFESIKHIPLGVKLDWIEEHLEIALEELHQLTLELGRSFLVHKQKYEKEEKENVKSAVGSNKMSLQKIRAILSKLNNLVVDKVPKMIEGWEKTISDVCQQYEKIKETVKNNESTLKEEIEEIRKGHLLPIAPANISKEIVTIDPKYELLDESFVKLNDLIVKLNSSIDRLYNEYESSRPIIRELENGLKSNLELLIKVNEAKRIYNSERFKDMLSRAKEANLL